MTAAVRCESLHRIYRAGAEEAIALDGIDLAVEEGTVFGLLGPNGAGKTTLVRILSTLLLPTSGRAEVLGLDVTEEPRQVRSSIGLILGGERGLFPTLTARENLEYFAGLFGLSRRATAERVDAVLADVRLTDVAERRLDSFSRGMRQRLHIARGLLNEPKVLFMDEPTIGLDPEAARDIRELVPRLRAAGVTILLTTHYMVEADLLCDELAVIDRGRIIARGTPEQLKRSFSRVQVVEVTVSHIGDGNREAVAALPGVRRVEMKADDGLVRLTVQAEQGADLKAPIAEALQDCPDCQLLPRGPTLEEAYLSLFWK